MSSTGRRGYGALIAKARDVEGLSPEDLAKKLGYKSKSIVYRLEEEAQEPDVELINKLVVALPLSAETLLAAMGLNLSLPLAAKLPYQLVEMLAPAPMEQHKAMIDWMAMVSQARGSDVR